MASQRKKWKLQCLINSNNKNLVPSCISGKKSKEKVKSGTSHSTKSLEATGVPLKAGMARKNARRKSQSEAEMMQIPSEMCRKRVSRVSRGGATCPQSQHLGGKGREHQGFTVILHSGFKLSLTQGSPTGFFFLKKQKQFRVLYVSYAVSVCEI